MKKEIKPKKLNYKVIAADMDVETGISYCTIQTKLGQFTATSQRHIEDELSSFAGCNYAEFKAVKKGLKAELKKVRYLIDFCLNTLIPEAEQIPKDSQEKSFFLGRIYRKVEKLEKEKREIIEGIALVESGLQLTIKKREEDKKAFYSRLAKLNKRARENN